MMKSLSLSGALRPARRRQSVTLFSVLLERYRYRRHLKRLLETSPHLLADVGIDECVALQEVHKSLWTA